MHIYTIQHNPTLPHAVSTKTTEKTIFDVTCMVLWSMSYVLYQKKRKAINLHKCIFLNDAMRKKKKLLPKFEKNRQNVHDTCSVFVCKFRPGTRTDEKI